MKNSLRMPVKFMPIPDPTITRIDTDLFKMPNDGVVYARWVEDIAE